MPEFNYLSPDESEKVNQLRKRAEEYDHGLRQNALAQRMGAPNAVKKWWQGLHPLDQAALATGPVPVVGDIVGVAADARMYAQEPESRTIGNYLLSAAGILPFVPGALGIIAGKGAKTADLVKLGKAKKMAKAGIGKEDIYKATGWWQGPDKKWRFEIDDSAAKAMHNKMNFIDHTGLHESEIGRPLKKYVKHKDLYKAYPELKHLEAGRTNYVGKDAGYITPKDQLYFSMGKTKRPVKTILGDKAVTDRFLDEHLPQSLHEIQHAIQERERFATGGNIAEFLSGKSEEEAAEIYRRLFGEIEARAVAKRARMTPSQRLSKPPWLDFDLPEDQWIIK